MTTFTGQLGSTNIASIAASITGELGNVNNVNALTQNNAGDFTGQFLALLQPGNAVDETFASEQEINALNATNPETAEAFEALENFLSNNPELNTLIQNLKSQGLEITTPGLTQFNETLEGNTQAPFQNISQEQVPTPLVTVTDIVYIPTIIKQFDELINDSDVSNISALLTTQPGATQQTNDSLDLEAVTLFTQDSGTIDATLVENGRIYTAPVDQVLNNNDNISFEKTLDAQELPTIIVQSDGDINVNVTTPEALQNPNTQNINVIAQNSATPVTNTETTFVIPQDVNVANDPTQAINNVDVDTSVNLTPTEVAVANSAFINSASPETSPILNANATQAYSLTNRTNARNTTPSSLADTTALSSILTATSQQVAQNTAGNVPPIYEAYDPSLPPETLDVDLNLQPQTDLDIEQQNLIQDNFDPNVLVREARSERSNFAQHILNNNQAHHAARAHDQIALNLQKGVDGQLNNIRLQLDPLSLGKVEIDFDFSQEGHVRALVLVDEQETLDLLKQDARNLEKVLEEAGFSLDQGGLEFDLRQGGGFEQNNQNTHQNTNNDDIFDLNASDDELALNDANTDSAILLSAESILSADRVNIIV